MNVQGPARTPLMPDNEPHAASAQPAAVPVPRSADQVAAAEASAPSRASRWSQLEKHLRAQSHEAVEREAAGMVDAVVPHRDAPLQGDLIAKNAALASASLASTFGVLGAVNNAVRASGCSPALKVASAFAPVVAGFASAHVEARLGRALDVQPTANASHAHKLDLVQPAAFAATTYAYMLSQLPKFSPLGLKGALVAVGVTATGAALGAVAREALAQDLPDRSGKSFPGTTTHAKGVGRAVSQIPASAVNRLAVAQASGGLAPAATRLLPAVVASGFAVRHQITPVQDAPAPASDDPASKPN